MVKLLLVTKDEQSCQILDKELRQHSYDVVTTNQGDEGLVLATLESPELILMDIDTPVVNGWQAIKTLKQSKATWLIPVIGMADRTVDGQLLSQVGFDTYVRRPVSLKNLLLKIEVLLDRSFANQTELGQAQTDQATLSTDLIAEETSRFPWQAGIPTVAYVNNSPTDSWALAKVVHRAGYNYIDISDSLQALPQLLQLNPQLIFLNLIMPVGNGYELCAQIRRLPAFKRTPIIIVSNNNGIVDRVRAKVVDASGFINRPLEESRILSILTKNFHLFQI